MRIPCPRYYELLDSLKKSEEVKAYLNTLQGLYQSLSLHTGLTIKDPDDVQSLYNTMLSEVSYICMNWNNWFYVFIDSFFVVILLSAMKYDFILIVKNVNLLI